MSFVPTYLLSRNGIWYFNYRVPTFLRNRYNIQKLFVRKSLRTTDVREAVKVSRKYTCLIVDNIMSDKKPTTGRMKISGQIRANDPGQKLRDLEGDQELVNDILVVGRKVAEEYDRVFKEGLFAEQEDFWKEYSEFEYECYRYAVNKKNKQQTRNKLEEKQAENQFVKKIGDEVQVTVVSDTGKSAVPESSITINDLIEEYISDKVTSNDWKESVVDGNKQMLWVIRDFLECIVDEKNPMIYLFKPKHSKDFKQLFCKYPKNCTQKFPDKTKSEIFTLIKSGKIGESEQIGDQTYNDYVIMLMAVFRWAKEDSAESYMSGIDNVFRNMKITVRDAKKQPPFRDDELHKFFNSDMFTKKDFEIKYSWRYWVPVIMLYHGTRLEEVCQLLIKNIITLNGVMGFQLQEERDDNGRTVTTLKTKSSERFIPVHKVLLDIGFNEYVEYLKSKNETKLFPKLSNVRASDGKYKKAGATVSKWFNEDSVKQHKTSYFTRVGIDKKSTNLKLYSFRHTVETKLINHQDNIEHDKIDCLIGHEVQSMGRSKYGDYFESTIKDVVDKIAYPKADLPWNVDEKYNDIHFPWEYPSTIPITSS